MDTPKKFFHDRLVLLLVTVVAILVVVGVGIVLLRFDQSRNPTTVVAYRPNITGSQYQSGKPVDIYSLAVFMLLSAVASIVLGLRIYSIKRSLAMFLLSSEVFLLILAAVVANSLISIQ